MDGLPQLREITLKSYLDEINKSIECRNYLSALTISLMIPDICSKYLGYMNDNGKGYKMWFDKYVYEKYYVIPHSNKQTKISNIKFDGKTCYSLRCSILHEGTTPLEYKYIKEEDKKRYKKVSLSVNGNSDRNSQYGEASFVSNYANIEELTSRINIVNLANNIIEGCNEFLREEKINDIRLFAMTDWDKKGNIIFTPKSRE